MLYSPNRETERVVYRTHPLGVPFCEVVIHRDNVDAFFFEGIQIDGKGGNKGFPFTCFHLCNCALMEYNAAEDLNVKVSHPESAPGYLPYHSKGFRKNIIERSACFKFLSEFFGFFSELFI
jgi:hypothetical protein